MRPLRHGWTFLCFANLLLAAPAAGQTFSAPAILASPPAADDYSYPALRAYERSILERLAAHYRDVPLDLKAEFFEWALWRYHRTPYQQVYNRARLPDQAGRPPVWVPGPDNSTWNGALLAALSYKYAVTRERETLDRIADLLAGMHLFLTITGQRGLPARSVVYEDGPVEEGMQPGVGEDGTRYFYRSSAAKGTVNQIAAGYAVMMMHVYDDLPADVQQRARDDLHALVLHVIDHNYHLTERTGQRTPYGDLTPLVGSIGVPFNAQVAYLVVATGRFFPPADQAARDRMEAQFGRLRHRHHAYWARPLVSLIQPQRVAASPFLKGMNDRNHVTVAAFVGLELDRYHARRDRTPLDRKFVHRLGQTMLHSAFELYFYRNSLCNFMWAALVADDEVFDAIVERKPNTVRTQAERMLAVGVEQLRRFPLDRFAYQGHEVVTPQVVWVDQFRPDDYYWKCVPTATWQITGPTLGEMYCAIDYLHAYWLLRHYGLDRHHAVAALPVLRPTLELRTLPATPALADRN